MSPNQNASLGALSEASQLLASSLDHEATIASVARLAMPDSGTWCIVDMVDADGEMRRLAVVHRDPDKQMLARQLQDGWPPDRDDALGAPVVMRTRQPEIISDVDEAMLLRVARTPENLVVLRALGMGSLLVLPLIARGTVLGAITFVRPEGGQPFGADDLMLGQTLSGLAALALDNSRLYEAAIGRAEAEEARADAEAARAEAEEARAESEASSRAKTLFLATMSHELRTPLNAIAGYTELLEMGLRGPLTAEQREYLLRIRRSQRHLLGLINDVLNFARIEAGQIEYHPVEVPIYEMVTAVEVLVAPQIAAQQLAFHRLCAADARVYVDREKAQQVLLNLLSNALKFSDPGGSITVDCELGQTHVAIRVTDTGRGMPPESVERIFEPFLQVDPSLTRTAQGSGLGLTISRDLARGLGGDVTVERTAVGQGSTFRFTVPRAANGGDS